MTKYYLGIDPGKEGAFVLIDSEKQIILHRKMPMIKMESKDEYDITALIAFFKALATNPSTSIFIEKVNAMPGQGVTSMFSMGRGCGLLEMGAALSGCEYSYVRPQVWKKELMPGMPKDKMASVVAATRVFPGCEAILAKPRKGHDHNMADALLIAEWGRRRDSR